MLIAECHAALVNLNTAAEIVIMHTMVWRATAAQNVSNASDSVSNNSGERFSERE
jgi:hypothetical protein